MGKKPNEITQVNLRIPERLRLTLTAEAKKSKRSFNAELAHRLQESCRRETRSGEIVSSMMMENAVEAVLERYGLIKRGGPQGAAR